MWVLCFPHVHAESLISLPFSGCVSSHCFIVETEADVFPHNLWLDVGSFSFWVVVDSYWVVLAMIGLRMTQVSISPAKDLNGLVLLRVCSGWSLDCVGVGMKVEVCLINLVCLGATQIEIEG